MPFDSIHRSNDVGVCEKEPSAIAKEGLDTCWEYSRFCSFPRTKPSTTLVYKSTLPTSHIYDSHKQTYLHLQETSTILILGFTVAAMVRRWFGPSIFNHAAPLIGTNRDSAMRWQSIVMAHLPFSTIFFRRGTYRRTSSCLQVTQLAWKQVAADFGQVRWLVPLLRRAALLFICAMSLWLANCGPGPVFLASPRRLGRLCLVLASNGEESVRAWRDSVLPSPGVQ